MTARAWDDTRPPDPAIVSDCVHCGFCLPTCPTYSLWAEEMDSPRGRIVLIGEGHEQGSRVSDALVTHLDRCLGCMACVTACPSGVRYDALIEDARAQVERRHRRALADRLFRRLLFALFPHPARLRALVPLLALARLLRVDHAAARLLPPGGEAGAPPPRGGGRLRALVALAPPPPARERGHVTVQNGRVGGEARERVALLQGCVQRVFFPHVNRATAAVLAAEGFRVEMPNEPSCCGALEMHAGEPGAVERAKQTIVALEGYDLVVANAAGCGSGMKDYPHLLRDDREWAARAKAFAAKVRDVHELLAEEEPRAPRHPLALRAAYHDACHLAHAQGVRAQPRRLLTAVPGFELVEPEGWEICCGSAGVYNLLEPVAAAQLGRRKAQALLATGAHTVVAANPGCALQIGVHARALGTPVRVLHPMEVLSASIEGRRP